MYKRTKKLRIVPFQSNPFFRNPTAEQLVMGKKVNVNTEEGVYELELDIVTEVGLNKPFPYRLKGTVFLVGKPSGKFEAEYNPGDRTGTITIQSY